MFACLNDFLGSSLDIYYKRASCIIMWFFCIIHVVILEFILFTFYLTVSNYTWVPPFEDSSNYSSAPFPPAPLSGLYGHYLLNYLLKIYIFWIQINLYCKKFFII